MERPKIDIEKTPVDWFLELIGILLIAAMVGYPLFFYDQMPGRIPTHFNASGVADGFGSKVTVWTLPVIGVIMYIGLTILNHYPHIFNYPKEITGENAERQYTLATRLIRSLNTIIAAVFFYITFSTIRTALNEGQGLGSYFLPIMMTGTLGAVAIYLYFVYRK